MADPASATAQAAALEALQSSVNALLATKYLAGKHFAAPILVPTIDFHDFYN